MGRNISHPLTVVHYGDPWCWHSWGLEPVVQRLHEVYGDQVEIVYRMGGVFDDLMKWRAEYGIEDDEGLRQWVRESDKLMGNPFDVDYVLKCGMMSTWPACVAVKAALLQGKQTMTKFYRKLMEAIQIHSLNGCKESVLKSVATECGLDVDRFMHDFQGGQASEMFRQDRNNMAADKCNYYSLLVVDQRTDERRIVSGYSSAEYESAIDELSKNSLAKKTPIDILEYFDRKKGLVVTAREIAEVFGINQKDAERRLSGLAKSGILKSESIQGAGHYWSFSNDAMVRELTIDQVNLSHVTDRSRVSEASKLEDVVKSVVQTLYTQVASEPERPQHFPVGREGLSFVGYPASELERIPTRAAESFAGVGYVHGTNAVREGDVVLDVGSGSGTDVFVASLRAGPTGGVIGVDFTDAMIKKATENVVQSGVKNIKIMRGEATKIPLDNNSVDVVTSNGVLNLVPNKHRAFEEIFRVLRPGRRLQLADIVVDKDVQSVCGVVPQLWADCIGGAMVENDYVEGIRKAGFVDVRVEKKLDYFSKASSDSVKRLTRTFGANAIVLSAKKPA